MPRYFGDGGHLRATGTTAGGLVHVVLLHTSTYQPEASSGQSVILFAGNQQILGEAFFEILVQISKKDKCLFWALVGQF